VTHAGSVADSEADIIAAGAQIIWVLEQNSFTFPGTATDCRAFMDFQGSTAGLCVGDSQTQPVAGTFDASPFSVARGFDIIVPLDTMEIVWSSSHGTPNGNDNLTGAEVLVEVQAAIANL